MDSHYRTLGVTRDAALEDIKQAYIQQAKKHHPDAGGNPATFFELNTAYKILSNVVSRTNYDTWLAEKHTLCKVCGGRGMIVQQRSFTQRTSKICDECYGAGVTHEVPANYKPSNR